MGDSVSKPSRIVTDTMFGVGMPNTERWSDRVVNVLGQNPGPFTGPGTNTYIIGTGKRRLLLDTGQGVPEYLGLLEGALRDLCGGAQLEALVMTHAHPDHIGGVAGIQKRWGALPARKMPWPEFDGELEIDPLEDGCKIRTEGATLVGHWTPGHAKDHLCFVLEEEKALFTGDVVLGAGTTVIPRNGDLGQYLASLTRLLALDVDVIYPAHGPAIHEPHRKIREYLAHRALRDQQILEAIDAGVTRVEAMVKRIYTDIPEFLYPAAGTSVEAHLRRFDEEGILSLDGDDWVRVL